MDQEDQEVVNTTQTETEAATTPQAEEQTGGSNLESSKDDKTTNLEKGLAQSRRVIKELKTELQRFQTSSETSQEAAPDQAQALELLRSVIREEIAPIAGELNNAQRDRVITEVFDLPYSKELAPEIKEEFDGLPDSMPFDQRLMVARANAIASNVDTISKISREAGKEEAYNNQTLKKGQTGLGENPNAQTTETDKTWFQKMKDGELTRAEISEHYEEIQSDKKKQLGIS